jgi:hypothetical protein
MSDLGLLADTMEEWSTTSGDHHMLAAAAIRQLIKLQASLQHSEEPVVPEGYVLVSRAAVTEVLRISDRQHPAWEEVRTALLSAGKGGEV